MTSVSDWLDEVSGKQYIWYVKRLSGNDTLANGTHQAGPYIPRDFILGIFPSMAGKTEENQKRWIDCFIDSHRSHTNVCATWYNNKFRSGTRNEARLTNFGGQSSALLDPENTGALAILAFKLDHNAEARECHVWVARNEKEEYLVEERIGTVEPGSGRIWSVDSLFHEEPQHNNKKAGFLSPADMPASWLHDFPDGMDIIRKAVELSACRHLDPDHRLIRRRLCEYNVFRSIEEAVELPQILRGFSSIEDFTKKAQSILQRRKSRSGRSLELHIMEILIEEGFEKDQDFSWQATSELGKKPDFLFPSAECYRNASFPDHKLRMLAVKTTCKDRWRQILNEADRIGTKHLLTLQEGISINQFREMQQENVQLVVPSPVISSYAQDIQPHLQTFEHFIRDAESLGAHKQY